MKPCALWPAMPTAACAMLSLFSTRSSLILVKRKQRAVSSARSEVVEALGVHETNSVTQFLSMMLDKNIKGLIALVGSAYQAGVDLKHFTESCLEEVRLLYMMVLAREGGETISAEELDIAAGISISSRQWRRKFRSCRSSASLRSWAKRRASSGGAACPGSFWKWPR